MMVVYYNSKFFSIFHQTLREPNIFSSISWLIFYENITFRYLSFFDGIFLYGFRLRYFFICYFAIWHYNLAIFIFFYKYQFLYWFFLWCASYFPFQKYCGQAFCNIQLIIYRIYHIKVKFRYYITALNKSEFTFREFYVVI